MPARPFPPLTPGQTTLLVDKSQSWGLAHGLVMYPPGFVLSLATVAPLTLFPTPFPKQAFEQALAVQQTFNRLYTLVASSKGWIESISKDLSAFDPDFTGKLYTAYEQALAAGIVQPLLMGLFRLDYMVHSATNQIKQIEFNTVSVLFGGLSSKVADLHRFLNALGAYTADGSEYYPRESLPTSASLKELGAGLVDGDEAYRQQQKLPSTTATCIVMVTQPGERNVFDQRHVEYAVGEAVAGAERPFLPVHRTTLQLVLSDTLIDARQRLVWTATGQEVSVVYYRSGYSPDDYPEAGCWEARLRLEALLAIKCPLLLTQLAGAKKIQQILTTREEVRRFLPAEDDASVDGLLLTFVAIYPLDDSPRGAEAKRLALTEPHRFVLKPQREGGGNNVYKENIPGFLKQLPEREWAGYILMELISPPEFNNVIVRGEDVHRDPIISELGVFGTTVFNEQSGEVLTNRTGGWLLRSKFSSSDEGGVAAGFGCVDSVYLYE